MDWEVKLKYPPLVLTLDLGTEKEKQDRLNVIIVSSRHENLLIEHYTSLQVIPCFSTPGV